MSTTADPDPAETKEWLEAFDAVLQHDGTDRAEELLETLVAHTRSRGLGASLHSTTPYVNTIATADAEQLPTDQAVERKVRSLVRWNALATVLQANKDSSELGGHIASFQSAATLYEVGFNHFWRAASDEHGGDLVYIQGHSSPGIYARAFLEGRLPEEQMRRFREETDRSQPGLSSYPHPWLMPEFWQFPTVSMGLGPIMGIYQARFLKYLQGRGMADTKDRDVWVFCGDGEMDEPESMGAIGMAGREKLDNLNFVINCNLQRLDGPVRGNAKIIQELEANFRGAGWNVIKVIWGSKWDRLIQQDTEGHLLRLMEETVDGEYQALKSRDGAFVRENFFGKHPETAKMVEDWTDDEVWALNRGGHDPAKVYAAYAAARAHKGQPTVILAKTIKGYGMGASGEGQNITHQQKKMTEDVLLAFRERFGLDDLTDDQVKNYAFHKPADDSPEITFLKEQREKLGGSLPARRRESTESLPVPDLSVFKAVLDGSGDREISTTMAFVRLLAGLLRDKAIKKHVVPIVPDESRTFGMEGMFRQLGIFSQVGQLYQPEDSEQLMFYREDRQGQILQEGINEPGAFSSWIAAATSYSNSDTPMIPFYVYYSMFGFQRIGDLAWAAGDSRARGFLIGGTAGRTTLNGEGLQHEDGHSLVQAGLIPNCVSYDPAYGYELAVIVHDGLRRMYGEQEDVFYYLTVMNENYRQPALPEGAEEGILRGIHRVREAGTAEAGTPEHPDVEDAGATSDADAKDDGGLADDAAEAGDQKADGDAAPADGTGDAGSAEGKAGDDDAKADAGEKGEDAGGDAQAADSGDDESAAVEADGIDGAQVGDASGAVEPQAAQVRLLGSGTILREVIAAAELLEEDWGVAADVYSVTSFTELRRDGLAVQRQNWLHPEDEPQTAYVSEVLEGDVPIVASTDYIRELADGIRSFVTAPYFVLGTDGYGRSDYRKALRGFFEVDRRHVVLAALTQLAEAGEVERSTLTEAIAKYEIKTDEGAPWAR